MDTNLHGYWNGISSAQVGWSTSIEFMLLNDASVPTEDINCTYMYMYAFNFSSLCVWRLQQWHDQEHGRNVWRILGGVCATDANSDQLCICHVGTLLWKITSYARKALNHSLTIASGWFVREVGLWRLQKPMGRSGLVQGTLWQRNWRRRVSRGVCVLFHVSVALMILL